MQKVLIADGSRVFMDALADKLKAKFAVMTCADGRSAGECLASWQPDILILNLMLPYVDGITLLQEAKYQPTVILAITMHMSAYVEQAVSALGVDYTMIAPSVSAVERRLEDLLAHCAAPADKTDINAQILHHLRMLNVPSHLNGYQQLCIALQMFCDNPHLILTKELYPAVAKRFGCQDGRNVEHSIRKSIHAAWKQRDYADWRKYFSPGPHGRCKCPTNKEFIYRIVEIIISDSSR